MNFKSYNKIDNSIHVSTLFGVSKVVVINKRIYIWKGKQLQLLLKKCAYSYVYTNHEKLKIKKL